MRKILTFSLLALAVALALAACRPASVIPPTDPDDPNIPGPAGEQTVSVALLKTLYTGAPVRITGEYRISGAVVSDDRQGNFHKTLVVDDGTGGIEIRMDVEQIFKRFLIHSRVTVRCNGLWLGSYGGTLQLGTEPFGDYQTQLLSEVEVAERVYADEEFYGEVRARTLTFGELTQRHISTFAAFEGVRFAEQERGLSWAETSVEEGIGSGDEEGEVEPPSATNRHLVDASGDTLIVRTSRYARFASWPLPRDVGRIEGVVGYFNGDYQLVVSGSQDFSSIESGKLKIESGNGRSDF
ncbi:MAG: DUF5689 domain-containing protein [Alistipes sp.]|jgi:hypothetical protein|nr:DUF5689 domain-containing protein [Alistipes sp.]